MGIPELLPPVVVMGLFVYPTFTELVRSAAAKNWGWFWVILGMWGVGLGWAAGWTYILGPGKRTG